MHVARRPLRRALALFALATLVVAPAMAQESASFDGAWKVVERWGNNPNAGDWKAENIQPSVYLFSGGYYSVTAVGGEEPRPQIPEGKNRGSLTAEEAIAIWGPYTSNSGTFEVSGSEVTMRPIVALNPEFMDGGSATYTYRFDDGGLTLSMSGDEWSFHVKLARY